MLTPPPRLTEKLPFLTSVFCHLSFFHLFGPVCYLGHCSFGSQAEHLSYWHTSQPFSLSTHVIAASRRAHQWFREALRLLDRKVPIFADPRQGHVAATDVQRQRDLYDCWGSPTHQSTVLSTNLASFLLYLRQDSTPTRQLWKRQSRATGRVPGNCVREGTALPTLVSICSCA